MTRYRLLITFLAVITCCGCVPKPVMDVIKPPEVEWAGVRDAVLLPFDGPEGRTVQHHVYGRLDKVLFFNALDTTGYPALDEVTYDMVEDAKSLHVTGEIGADIVIVGRATATLNDVLGAEEAEVREGTGYFKKEKNLDGEWVDVEIMRTVIRSVPYVIRHASLATDYRVFDVNSGRIMVGGTITEAFDKKFGGAKPGGDLEYQPGEAPPPEASLEELSVKAAFRLVAKISRMKITGTVAFDRGDDRLVRRGVVLAKRGDWDSAIQYWNNAIQKQPTDAAAHYNLGIAYETLGDLDNLLAARAFYEKAVTYGDNPLYAEGVTRIDRIINESMDQ